MDIAGLRERRSGLQEIHSHMVRSLRSAVVCTACGWKQPSHKPDPCKDRCRRLKMMMREVTPYHWSKCLRFASQSQRLHPQRPSGCLTDMDSMGSNHKWPKLEGSLSPSRPHASGQQCARGLRHVSAHQEVPARAADGGDRGRMFRVLS
jgi:hypothetical protein